MKNLLLTLFIASAFAACKTESKKEAELRTDMVPINTAGYKMSDATTDIAKYQGEEEEAAPIKKAAKRNNTIIYKTVYVPQPVQQQAPVPVYTNTNPGGTTTAPQTQAETYPSSTGAGTSSAEGTVNSGNEGTETTATPKKKGWSDAAKGAVIGGAAGAIGGAVINGKNRGKGAIIGAVIGAAGGYVIGRKRDKNKDESNPYSMVVN
ncbi:MAG: YMGG-like glycine zipper-containing protein [Ferruginibacter sp.]